ncbi:MAG: hypothetical protein V4485_02665 [Pseudomonadota bacterium]
MCEHTLSNAPDVTDVCALEHTNGECGNPPGRFKSGDLQFIPDPAHPRNWGSSNLHFEFDITEAEASVKDHMQQASSPLSASTLLCAKPIAPQGTHASFLLSDLISDILPKIKIFASKHVDGSIQVLPHVFLDDRNDPAQNLIDCRANCPAFFFAS